MAISLPDVDDRTVIVGSTGSGKTFAGIWLLSTRDYMVRPAVIFDLKRDRLIAQLPAKEISIRGKPPTEPGLYVVRPFRGETDAIEAFLWKCWDQEDLILYIDEGYMMGRFNKALSAIYTQGRSKNIEVITLTQRPTWLNPFMLSEATFFWIFNLTSLKDRKTVGDFILPRFWTPKTILQRHHSVWYDVGEARGEEFLPVPDRSGILGSYRRVQVLRRHRVI